MPATDKPQYVGADCLPNVIGGAIDHFCSKHWIDGERETDSMSNDYSAISISRDPFRGKEDRLLPCRLVEHCPPQLNLRICSPARAFAHEIFDIVTSKPFLKLLVLE
jgi:hypothetical protein